MGRFISPDPSGLAYADPTNPQSLNLYGYALNNPMRFVDPTGLSVQICTDDGSGGTQCNTVDNSTYSNAARGDNGSLDVPSLNDVQNGSGFIYDGDGNVVGTAIYSADGSENMSAGSGQNSNAPNKEPTPQQQAVDKHIKDCTAKASAAAAQQPSLAPNGNSILMGLFNAGVTMYRAEKLASGVVGFVQGLVVRPVVNFIQKEAAYDGALNACLNPGGYMTGVGMVW